ncbi:DUF6900 domain-containing protein [Paraburkholderia tropica]|uniref:DUF6900 domain-containing protein n=1 Tax=Paraburkholderia tropica TaxID=92647 RepID=UPI003AFAE9B4
MNPSTLPAAANQQLAEIAATTLGLETLETRHADRLDSMTPQSGASGTRSQPRGSRVPRTQKGTPARMTATRYREPGRSRRDDSEDKADAVACFTAAVSGTIPATDKPPAPSGCPPTTLPRRPPLLPSAS